jgi:hypothetical protein
MRRLIDFAIAPIVSAILAYWAATTGIRQMLITRRPVSGGAVEVIGQQVSVTFSGIFAALVSAAIAVYVIVRLAKLLRSNGTAA